MITEFKIIASQFSGIESRLDSEKRNLIVDFFDGPSGAEIHFKFGTSKQAMRLADAFRNASEILAHEANNMKRFES
jgi:hypothetical protein